eukprot:23791_1
MAISIINSIFLYSHLSRNKQKRAAPKQAAQKRFKIMEYFIKFENINNELLLQDLAFFNCYCEMISTSKKRLVLLIDTFKGLNSEQNISLINRILKHTANFSKIIKSILKLKNINKELMLSDAIILNSYCKLILSSNKCESLLNDTFEGINNDNIKTNIASMILSHLFANSHSLSILTRNESRSYKIIRYLLKSKVNVSSPINNTTYIPINSNKNKNSDISNSFFKAIKTNVSLNKCQVSAHNSFIIKSASNAQEVIVIDYGYVPSNGYARCFVANIDSLQQRETLTSSNKINKYIPLTYNHNTQISEWSYSFDDVYKCKLGQYSIGCYDERKRLHIIDAQNKVHYVSNTTNGNNHFKFRKLHDLNNKYWRFNAWWTSGLNLSPEYMFRAQNNLIYVPDIISNEHFINNEKEEKKSKTNETYTCARINVYENNGTQSLFFHVFNTYNNQWTLSAPYPLKYDMCNTIGTNGPRQKEPEKKRITCAATNDFILVFNKGYTYGKMCILYDMTADQWITQTCFLFKPITSSYSKNNMKEVVIGNLVHRYHFYLMHKEWKKDLYKVIGYKQIHNGDAMI